MNTPDHKSIGDLFVVKSGDCHATKELDPGTTPLISCGDKGNGCVGYFDIARDQLYYRAITVAYNGSWPLTAKFHPYEFGAKDDVAVLCPKVAMKDKTLLYIAAMLVRMTWRYSYGRKCFKKKLKDVRIPMVMDRKGQVDENAIARIFPDHIRGLVPKRNSVAVRRIPRLRWKSVLMRSLFDISRGDFHAIDDLAPGKFVTVSRITEYNGVVGYFERPDGAQVYPSGAITVSTVGGDAFVQLEKFIATDNVIICSPKKPLPPATLLFIAFAVNRQKWRYSYARQCYIAKFNQTEIFLPVMKTGEIDEESILAIVESASYWPQLELVFARTEGLRGTRS